MVGKNVLKNSTHFGEEDPLNMPPRNLAVGTFPGRAGHVRPGAQHMQQELQTQETWDPDSPGQAGHVRPPGHILCPAGCPGTVRRPLCISRSLKLKAGGRPVTARPCPAGRTHARTVRPDCPAMQFSAEHQILKRHNFCIRTPIEVILGSLERGRRVVSIQKVKILIPSSGEKIPHMARCGTFLKDEPVIFSLPKTQQGFHMKSVFDELELGMEMNTSSNSSHG